MRKRKDGATMTIYPDMTMSLEIPKLKYNDIVPPNARLMAGLLILLHVNKTRSIIDDLVNKALEDKL